MHFGSSKLTGRWWTFGSGLACAALAPALLSAQTAQQTSKIARVSVSSGGAQGNALSSDGLISADGRLLAFSSDATTLVPGDVNGFRDVFLRDRSARTTTLVSVSSGGVQGDALSSVGDPIPISADGRYVAFYSSAT